MKLKISILLLVAFSIRDAQAQTQEQKDSIKNVSLNEVVISGNKFS